MEHKLSVSKPATHSKKQLTLSLVFGIPAMAFACACATFVTIMSLFGLSFAFSDKGLLPMAFCLLFAYLNAMLAVLFSVFSQKTGMINALNKVSLALSIASSCAATLIFGTLVLALIARNTGFLI